MSRASRASLSLGLALSGVGGLACRGALATVLDLPPPRPGPPVAAPGPGSRSPAVPMPSFPMEDSIRPAIESVTSRDSVAALLPHDRAGNVDWVAALRLGVIRPRETLRGSAPAPAANFQFAFDFNYQGPDTLFDAIFPHSTHTEWVACQQCHPRIFPYRNTRVTMADVSQGKFCGECHGKVSFPVATGCERCHRRLTMPPNRAKPDLLGDIPLARFSDDSGNARGLSATDLPRATFPHWTHRIRFRCKVCHLGIFEPRAGANRVTMRGISAGETCGRCHDGITAFAPSISNCQQCHVGSVAPPPPPPPPAQ